MEWFRHYHGLCKDEKLTAAAMAAGVTHCVAVAAWCYVLEHGSATRRRGDVTECHARHCAIALRIDVTEATEILGAFVSEGLITDGQITNWDKLQFASDSSAERTKKWRERNSLEVVGQPDTPTPATPKTSRKRTVTTGDVTETSRDAPEQSRTDKKEDRGEREKRVRSLDELTIDDELSDLARTEGRNAERELKQFTDNCRSKEKTYKDYRSAFRNWLRSPYGKPLVTPDVRARRPFGHGDL
jgi:hypothetical protein